MAHNRSDLSMPRTGIHGGLRRGAAAAAVGAVLVLTTGVPASQAKEGAPDPGDPAAPAVDTKSLPVVAPLKGQSAAAREKAPGQDREGKSNDGKDQAGKGKGKDSKQAASPSPAPTPSASAIPSALRPAVKATQKPAAPSGTAPASPVPTSSAPAASTPTATRSATSAPAGSTPASSGTAPAAAPSVPVAVPEAPGTGAPAGPATPAAAGGTTPAQPAPPASTVAADPSMTAAGEPTADAAAGEATTAAAGGVGGQAGYVPLYAVPHTQAGWTPYASVPNTNSVRSSAVLAAQPEPKSAMVWLGSGLVGVAGAAGLVFFRLRNP